MDFYNRYNNRGNNRDYYNIPNYELILKVEEINRLETLIEEKNQKISNLENNIEEKRKDNYELKQMIEVMDQKIKSQDEEIKSQDEKIKSQEKEIKSQDKKIKSQDKKIKSQDETIKSYDEIIESQDVKLKSQEEKLKSQDEKLKSQDKKIKTQDKKIKDKSDEIKDKDNQIKKNNNQLSKLESDNKNYISLIEEKNKINSELEQKNKLNNEKILDLQNKIFELKKENKSKDEKNSRLESYNSQINKELKDMKTAIKNKENENNKLKNSIENNILTISSLENNIKISKENIYKKKEEISINKKKIDELNNLLLLKDKDIENLKDEPSKLKIKNEQLNKDNFNQKNKIIKNVEEINKLKETIQQLKIKIENEGKNYNKLNNEYEKLKIDGNDKDAQLQKYKEESKEFEDFHKLKSEIKIIKENADKSLKYQDLRKEDFYDLIIKCNSIIGLKKGWDITMTEDGKKNYFEYKDNKYTKIGVIGSENRGKSTILSDFSKIELPTGVSIKTEGLSIKYPKLDDQFKNRKIILLDSAGLETPILNTHNNEEDKNEEKTPEEKKENGKDELKVENKKEELNDIFANKSRDVIQLELFLQNFIIKYSDILILILGKLTINEQKLLLKVKTHIKNLKRKEPLLVIHNLKDFETKKQVDDYLESILKKSSTFSLKDNDIVNLESQESKWKYYFEPKSDPKIYHLIYGKKGSEAGDFYNEKTIKFIYDLISSNPDKESFDPIKCVKEYFSEISEIILDNKIEKNEIIDSREVSKDSDKSNANIINKIMLKDQNKEIILKQCLIDELGISNFKGNNFDAQYSYYITEKNVYIYIELPGKKEKSGDDKEYENVEVDLQTEGSFSIIKVTGTKKHFVEHFIQEKNINHQQHKRQFGDFSIQVKLDKINLNDDYQCKIQNGCLLVTFDIKKGSKKRQI